MRPRHHGAGRRIAVGALLAATLCACGASAQQFVSTGRDTLRGLPGVEVLVEPTPAELADAGLTAASLAAGVAARLKAAGIVVYASQAENPSPAKPFLYVHLNALPLSDTLYAVAVQVHLRQTLQSPVTASNIVNAMTWDAHTLVGVAARDLALVREEVHEQVDRFIADWTAVRER